MSFSGTIAKSYFVIAARKFLDESTKPIPYLSCNSIVTYKTFLSQSWFFSNKYFKNMEIYLSADSDIDVDICIGINIGSERSENKININIKNKMKTKMNTKMKMKMEMKMKMKM